MMDASILNTNHLANLRKLRYVLPNTQAMGMKLRYDSNGRAYANVLKRDAKTPESMVVALKTHPFYAGLCRQDQIHYGRAYEMRIGQPFLPSASPSKEEVLETTSTHPWSPIVCVYHDFMPYCKLDMGEVFTSLYPSIMKAIIQNRSMTDNTTLVTPSSDDENDISTSSRVHQGFGLANQNLLEIKHDTYTLYVCEYRRDINQPSYRSIRQWMSDGLLPEEVVGMFEDHVDKIQYLIFLNQNPQHLKAGALEAHWDSLNPRSEQMKMFKKVLKSVHYGMDNATTVNDIGATSETQEDVPSVDVYHGESLDNLDFNTVTLSEVINLPSPTPSSSSISSESYIDEDGMGVSDEEVNDSFKAILAKHPKPMVSVISTQSSQDSIKTPPITLQYETRVRPDCPFVRLTFESNVSVATIDDEFVSVTNPHLRALFNDDTHDDHVFLGEITDVSVSRLHAPVIGYVASVIPEYESCQLELGVLLD